MRSHTLCWAYGVVRSGSASGTHPQLDVHSRRVLLDEGAIIGCNVPVVAVLLQHVDLCFNLLLLVLITNTQTHALCENELKLNILRARVCARVHGTYSCDVHDLNSSELTRFDMAAL